MEQLEIQNLGPVLTLPHYIPYGKELTQAQQQPNLNWQPVFPDYGGPNMELGLTPPKPDKFLIQLNYRNPSEYIPFVLFILSEVLLGIVGFYLSAADQNSNFHASKWNWANDSTYSSAVGGGVEGTLMPYAFFYSAEVIGIDLTIITGMAGAYIGGASANSNWDPMMWRWTSPMTLNGIFEGIQNTVWLVDAIASIHSFTKDSGLQGPEEYIFLSLAYGTGLFISYYYLAEENGNGRFWQWSLRSPNFLYGMIRGFESGTRLPVGFGETGVALLESLEKSLDKPDVIQGFVENILVRRRWKIAGALWLAIVYTSEENETLDIFKWNTGSFGTMEAFLNGLVFGKDLDEMFLDVRRYLLGPPRDNNNSNQSAPVPFMGSGSGNRTKWGTGEAKINILIS